MAELAADVAERELAPAVGGEQCADHLGGASSQGEEADAELLQLGARTCRRDGTATTTLSSPTCV